MSGMTYVIRDYDQHPEREPVRRYPNGPIGTMRCRDKPKRRAKAKAQRKARRKQR